MTTIKGLPAGTHQFPLSEFLGPPGTGRWEYRAGQHVTILAPTDWGKTFLGQRLLAATMRPKLPALNLVIKPRDATVLAFMRDNDMRRQRSWPPPPNAPWRRRPAGYAVWPTHTGDPDRDELMLYWTMRRALLDSYRRGNRIVFCDEAAGMINDISPPKNEPNLERYMRQLWTRGRSLGVGMWAATQRPVDVPLHAYSQAQHLFIGKDPDKRGRQRFAEIGGIDPALVLAITEKLPRWHWLYIKREGDRHCVITPG